MKFFKLTNRKTGKLLNGNFSQAQIDKLKATNQPHSENLKMIDLFQVEEFDVHERGGPVFAPHYIPTPKPTAAAVAVATNETKGPDASGHDQ